MAAILRSGKFLRIVSNLARTNQGGQQQQGQQTQQCPSIPNADAQPFHAWSLQHLQNALPILSAEHEKHDEIKKPEGQLRRGSDPLLEFYVDKQKIEEAAKKIVEPSRIGLNVVQDLSIDEKHTETVEVIEKKPIEIAKQNVEKKQISETNELTNEIVSDVIKVIPDSHEKVNDKVLVEESNKTTEEATETTLVPICEDPISHQWYPLPVVCQMFRAQGRIYDLEALLWGSYGIQIDDRKCIYYWTLQAYADSGMFPQAVDLTRRLESEGLDFPEYHSLMNNFAMAIYAQEQKSFTPSTAPSSTASQADQSHRKLKKGIANKDLNACLEHYRGQDLNVTEASSLIEMFVKEDMLSEAMEVTERMLTKESYPLPRIFRFLLNK